MPKAKKTPSRKNIYLPVVIGSISLLIVVITLLVKGALTDDQRYYFKILFAIGAAGVAAAIPGFLSIRFKNWLSAGGALAVFVFVYNNNPVTSARSFPYTIYLKDSTSNRPVGQADVRISMQIGSDRSLGEWSSKSGNYKFFNIPPEYKGSTVPVLIAPNGEWTFEKGEYSTAVKLDNEFSDLRLVRKCIISGTVLKDTTIVDGEENVVITVQGQSQIHTSTDKDGNFSLDLSNMDSPPPYTIVFRKGNFNMSYNLTCGSKFSQKLLKPATK